MGLATIFMVLSHSALAGKGKKYTPVVRAGYNGHKMPQPRAKEGAYFFHRQNQQCENTYGIPGYNLHGWIPCTDFRFRRLDGLNQPALQLTGSNFEGRSFKNIVFNHVNLSFANLTNTTITNSIFDGAVLTGTDLRGAQLDRVHFHGKMVLKGAIIDNSTSTQNVTVETHDNDNPIEKIEFTRDFAFLNDMIYVDIAHSKIAEFEVQGGTIQKIRWNPATNYYYVTLNLQGRPMHAEVRNPAIAHQANAFLLDQEPKKVIAGIRREQEKNILVFLKPLY